MTDSNVLAVVEALWEMADERGFGALGTGDLFVPMPTFSALDGFGDPYSVQSLFTRFGDVIGLNVAEGATVTVQDVLDQYWAYLDDGPVITVTIDQTIEAVDGDGGYMALDPTVSGATVSSVENEGFGTLIGPEFFRVIEFPVSTGDWVVNWISGTGGFEVAANNSDVGPRLGLANIDVGRRMSHIIGGDDGFLDATGITYWYPTFVGESYDVTASFTLRHVPYQ